MSSATSQDGVLTYTIADSTPHSGRYAPENILVDKPQEQSSRWSGAHQGKGKQWILLRLETPAILSEISQLLFPVLRSLPGLRQNKSHLAK